MNPQDWHQKQVDAQRRRAEQAARARQKMAGRGLAQVGSHSPLAYACHLRCMPGCAPVLCLPLLLLGGGM